MGKELKIVLVVIAIYLVLGIQNFANTSVFIIPYELNPLVILTVSAIVLIQSIKKSSLLINSIYLISVSSYALLSSRTLNILYNQFEINLFTEILNSVWTPLIAIVMFYGGILTITFKARINSFLWYLTIVFLILSFVGALLNIELIQVISFTLYVLSFLLLLKKYLADEKTTTFHPISYQLFLFVVIENLYFILTNYW